MPDRPRHQTKEIEAVLRSAEVRGWRVTKKTGGYFKMLCPCGIHIHWCALTPSNRNYADDLDRWLRRQPCWEA